MLDDNRFATVELLESLMKLTFGLTHHSTTILTESHEHECSTIVQLHWHYDTETSPS